MLVPGTKEGCLEPYFVFSHSGIYDGSYHNQLEAFGFSLANYGLKLKHPPKDWYQAFHLLKEIIRVFKKRILGRIIIDDYRDHTAFRDGKREKDL